MRSLWHMGLAAVIGSSVWLAGCTPLSRALVEPPAPVARGAQPEMLPAPKETVPPVIIVPPDKAHVVPISLDVVLRLARDQNGQINLARAKVNEAFAARELAGKRWLPDLYVGPSYYRHEGGIQDFTGNLIHSSFGSLFAGVEIRGKMDMRDLVFAKVDAERKIWRRHAELAKLTSENLLEAANTYIDLLAARLGEAVGRELEGRLLEALEKANQRKKTVPKAEEEVFRTGGALEAQRTANRRLREAANAAAAKLIYLLGLDPESELLVMERSLTTFDLVDANLPSRALVEQALSNGPGIRELEGLLAVIDEARAKASGPGRLLPTLEMTVAEGAFGAGPGDNMKWDNRLDLVLQARWNLTDLVTAGERRWLAQTKMQQAQITYQDLRAKLTMGVHEAREAILSGRDQLEHSRKRIQQADKAYERSTLFYKKPVAEGDIGNVLTAIEAVVAARFDYVRTIRAYDQAQLRLFILTGLADPEHHGRHAGHRLPARAESPPRPSGNGCTLLGCFPAPR